VDYHDKSAKSPKAGFFDSSDTIGSTESKFGQGSNWGDPNIEAVVQWFLATKPPVKPFDLDRATTIAVPPVWWASVLRDVLRLGPNCLRETPKALDALAILENHGWLTALEAGTVIRGKARKASYHIRRGPF
jgi:hypothetical protein